ncbi:MAG TPA: hypothetical protein VF975_05730, partial [Thermoanaerobaculia bacterium]
SIHVSIVPTGLYYTAKQTFRSSALTYFGSAIVVDPEPVDGNGEPRQESVERLTNEIERALAEVTLQADSHAALELIANAERIFTSGEGTALARELELRKQFIAGYVVLRDRDPGRLTRLESMIKQVDAERLTRAERIQPGRLLLAPIGIIGAAIHWPVYRLIGFLATHLSSKDDAMIATVKVIGGLVLYPLMWIAAAVVVGILSDWRWGIAALLALPIVGYVALLTIETFEDIEARVRRRDVIAQQQAIREEILAVARELNATTSSSPGAPSEA